MARVFISYRRVDTGLVASQIAAGLRQFLGEEAVFFDRTSILAGTPLYKEIEQAIGASAAVVVVIGPRFVESLTEAADAPAGGTGPDYMLLEIRRAMERKRAIIPVLVQGAEWPARDRLPASIRELADSSWLRIDDSHGYEDCLKAIIRVVNQATKNITTSELRVVPGAPDRSAVFTSVAEIVSRLELIGGDFVDALWSCSWVLAETLVGLRAAILVSAVRRLGLSPDTERITLARIAASPQVHQLARYGRALDQMLREGKFAQLLPESMRVVLAGSRPLPVPSGTRPLAEVARALPNPINELPLAHPDAWSFLETLLEHRDRLDRQAAALAPSLAAELRGWVYGLPWLWTYPFAYIERSEPAREGHQGTGTLWAGPGQAPGTFICREKVPDHTLVFDPACAALPLTPFFHVFNCYHQNCLGPRIFMVAGRFNRPGKTAYQHPACGYRMETPLLDPRWTETLRPTDAAENAGLVCVRERSPGHRAIRAGETFSLIHKLKNTSPSPLADPAVHLSLPPGIELVGQTTGPPTTLGRGEQVELTFDLRTYEEGRVIIPATRISWRTSPGRECNRMLPELSIPVVFGIPAALIGRDPEMARLREAQDEASSGKLQVLTIHGRRGIGKTALAESFLGTLTGRHGNEAFVLKTRCLQNDQDPPGAIADLLKRYLHYYVPRPAIEAAVRAALGWQKDHFFHRHVHLINLLAVFAHAVGLDPPVVQRFDGASGPLPEAPLDAGRRGELHAAVLDMFLHVTDQRPTVLFIDDAHFMHRDDWSLVRYLIKHLANRAVLVLLAAPPLPPSVRRTQEIPVARSRSDDEAMAALRSIGGTSLTLRPLDEDKARLLFQVLLGPQAEIAESSRNQIVATCQGVPAFLIDLIRQLHATGVLRRQDGVWQLDGAVDLILARALSEVIPRRFDSLPPDLRMILQAAAVVGERFDPVLLADLEISGTRLTAADVTDAIRQLCEFVRERDLGCDFISVEVHRLIYESLEPDERRALHRQVAQAVERQEAADPPLGMLAFHWQRAGNGSRAITCLEGHATRLEQNLAFDEAIRALKGAGRLAQATPGVRDENWTFDLVRKQSRLSWLSGHIEEATALDRDNVERGHRLHRFVDVCDVHRILSKTFFGQNKLDLARHHAREAYDLARRQNLPEAMQKVNLQLALLARAERRYPEAEARFEECRSYAHAAGHTWLEAEASLNLGILARMLGQHGQAALELERATTLYEALPGTSRLFGLSMTYHNLAALSEEIGQLDQAEYQIERSLRLRREAQDTTGLARGYHTQAKILFRRGKVREARERLQESLRFKRRIDDEEGVAKSMELEGDILAETDQWAAALEAYQGALALVGQFEHVDELVSIRASITRILCRLGRLPEAQASLEEIRAQDRRLWRASTQDQVELIEAWLARAAGRADEAWRRAEQLEASTRLPPGAQQRQDLSMFRALLLIERGLPEEAVALLRRTTEALGHTGSPFVRARVGNLLGKALLHAGRLEEALVFLHQTKAHIAPIEDPLGEAIALDRIATAELALGRPEDARQHLEQALALKTRLDDVQGVAISHALLARCREPEGQAAG